MQGFTAEAPADRRSQIETSLNGVMSSPYLVLPPTQRFQHTVVAHGDRGLVVVLMCEGMMFENPDTSAWENDRDVIHPESASWEAIAQLAEVARAPRSRIGCVVWLPSAIGAAGVGKVGLCTSPSPYDLARSIEAVMETRLTGVLDPMAPWIGAYAQMALGPKGGMEPTLRRVVSVIESVVDATVGGLDMEFYGDRIFPEDVADPRYMLPALVTAAFEDWALVVHGGRSGASKRKGFSVSLENDPAALLGYRVERLTPAAPFIVLAPIVSTLRRCLRKDVYVVDELAEQFGRYLYKHGLDSTIVEEVALRVLSSGDQDGE